MNNLLSVTTRIGDKASSLGAVVSTMGCAMCFPAIASLGTAVGLGFLEQWENLFLNTLIPFFAWFALAINALGWFSHHQWLRAALGVFGPILLLLSYYPWFQYAWSSYVTYSALAIMVTVSIWDMVSPVNKRCDDESCTV